MPSSFLFTDLLFNLCSEADAFVASSFRSLVPFSGQLAFMVLGPMLDVKLVLMYLGVFKRRAIAAIVVAALMDSIRFTSDYWNIIPASAVTLIAGGITFAVHFVALRRQTMQPYFTEPEVRSFWAIFVFAAIIVSFSLMLAAGMRGVREGYELPDEADANLDHAAISALNRVIERFEGTLLMVTHRRAVLHSCDHVWRLNDGRIAQNEAEAASLPGSTAVVALHRPDPAPTAMAAR